MEHLVVYIKYHGHNAFYKADENLIIAESRYTYVDAQDGLIKLGSEWEAIVPTMQAVRAWLGC